MGNGPLGMNVTGLHGAGTSMAGRSGTAQTHAGGLKTSVADAAEVAGHPEVKAALNSLLDEDILDSAGKLPNLISAGGTGIANVAATGRNSDNDGARDLKSYADATNDNATTLRRSINVAV